MRELFTIFLATQKSELLVINTNLKEIQQTNMSIEASVTRLSSQHDEFLMRM